MCILALSPFVVSDYFRFCGGIVGGIVGEGGLPCGKSGMLVILFRAVNHQFLSNLGCSGQSTTILVINVSFRASLKKLQKIKCSHLHFKEGIFQGSNKALAMSILVSFRAYFKFSDVIPDLFIWE